MVAFRREFTDARLLRVRWDADGAGAGRTGRDLRARGDDGQVDRVYFGDLIRGEIPKVVPGMGVMTRKNVIQLLGANGKKR